jgi:hypothetical protein
MSASAAKKKYFKALVRSGIIICHLIHEAKKLGRKKLILFNVY